MMIPDSGLLFGPPCIKVEGLFTCLFKWQTLKPISRNQRNTEGRRHPWTCDFCHCDSGFGLLIRGYRVSISPIHRYPANWVAGNFTVSEVFELSRKHICSLPGL